MSSKNVSKCQLCLLSYVLLENKEEPAYSNVFYIVMSSAQTAGIAATLPQLILSDFELAIINAAIAQVGDIVQRMLVPPLPKRIHVNTVKRTASTVQQ